MLKARKARASMVGSGLSAVSGGLSAYVPSSSSLFGGWGTKSSPAKAAGGARTS